MIVMMALVDADGREVQRQDIGEDGCQTEGGQQEHDVPVVVAEHTGFKKLMLFAPFPALLLITTHHDEIIV
jgi:hypothetical protein